MTLSNNIQGFSFKDKPKCYTENRAIRAEFTLYRAGYTKSLFIIVGIATFVFIVLIIGWVSDIPSLATSVGGFFISLWSIRGIIGHNIDFFPTYLDYFILVLYAALLIGILSKFVIRFYKKK
jgi:hypothetical protein